MTISIQPIPRRLLEPLSVGRIVLSNRIIMAPMTRCRAVDGNIPNEMAAAYYGQRASAGLIITEATQISESAQGYWRTPGLHNERQSAIWRRIVERVHAEGGRIFVQLWHNGRVFHPDNVPPGRYSVAPSAIAPSAKLMTPNGPQVPPVPRELSAAQIHEISTDFVLSAQRAIDCGFDGVEIHAANGYLIDQFLNSSSNRRTDQWGGTLENRARFLLDTAAAVCAAIGADRTGVRISPLGDFNDVHDPQPQEIYRYLASRLAELDLAYLHVIRPVVSGSSTRTSATGLDSGPVADPLEEIRARYRGTLLVAGDLDVATADGLVDAGLADGIAFGRWFISNPDLPQRLRRGWPLAGADRAVYYSEGAQGYIDFPHYSATAPSVAS